MQIKSDCSKEDIINDSDPLFLTYSPIGKIKLLADLVWGLDEDELEIGNIFNRDNKCALYEFLKDSCREIEFIVETSNERWREDVYQSRARKRVLEQILEGIHLKLDGHEKVLDLKAMVENIQKHI